MKILVICQHYWPEPFNVTETCEGLVRMGYEVTVLTGLPNYPEGTIPKEYRSGRNRMEQRNGVSIIRVPIIARGKDLSGFNKIRRVANYLSFFINGSKKAKRINDNFDCVLSIQYSPILMVKPGIVYSKRNCVPLVIYSYDLWPEDLLTGGFSRDGFPYKVMTDISKRMYGAADKLLVTSPGFSEYLNETLHLKTPHCSFLPQYAEDQFEAMVISACKKNNECHFLFAGNIGGNQSVETIVKAAGLIKDSAIVVDIVGAGSHFEACKELANSLKLENVTFHGRKPFAEMEKYYKQADCMLLTLSNSNGGSQVAERTIPRKLQSYLAAGKPIITSAPGVASKVVQQAGCGFSCKPECEEELASAMMQIASSPDEELRRLGANGKKYYLENYSKEIFFMKLDKHLKEMKEQ